ncbi:hypothetical protein RJG79_10865 [Mycoplasmatota bacterium WC44]
MIKNDYYSTIFVLENEKRIEKCENDIRVYGKDCAVFLEVFNDVGVIRYEEYFHKRDSRENNNPNIEVKETSLEKVLVSYKLQDLFIKQVHS